jgi:hypothetical protein
VQKNQVTDKFQKEKKTIKQKKVEPVPGDPVGSRKPCHQLAVHKLEDRRMHATVQYIDRFYFLRHHEYIKIKKDQLRN